MWGKSTRAWGLCVCPCQLYTAAQVAWRLNFWKTFQSLPSIFERFWIFSMFGSDFYPLLHISAPPSSAWTRLDFDVKERPVSKLWLLWAIKFSVSNFTLNFPAAPLACVSREFSLSMYSERHHVGCCPWHDPCFSKHSTSSYAD